MGIFENVADAKESGNGNGAARFDLLPVACREAKSDHVFLAVAMALSQFAEPVPQCTEEFLLVHHTDGCKVSQAETPRAD